MKRLNRFLFNFVAGIYFRKIHRYLFPDHNAQLRATIDHEFDKLFAKFNS